MTLVVSLEQLIHRDMSVALRRAQAGVPQKLLNRTQVGAAFQHVGRAGVTQSVWVQVRAPGAKSTITTDESLHRALRQSPTTLIEQ